MRDVLPDIERWRARGERVAVATVVSMAGSAPRRPGAKLVVSESGELAGSLAGKQIAIGRDLAQIRADLQVEVRSSFANLPRSEHDRDHLVRCAPIGGDYADPDQEHQRQSNAHRALQARIDPA